MTLAALIHDRAENREAWRYTDLAAWQDHTYARAHGTGALTGATVPLRSAVDGPLITFIDGIWAPAQSDLRGLPHQMMTGDAADGYVLTLAGETCLITMPLTVRYLASNQASPVEAHTKLRIEMGGSCRLTLVEEHAPVSGDGPYVDHTETEILLAPQAKLVHAKITCGASLHVGKTKVRVASGAYYDAFSMIVDGALTRHVWAIDLEGAMAQCHVQGISLLRGSSQGDQVTTISHKVAETTSRQVFKSVLDEKAHGVFTGKIFVDKDAQKTDGFQLSRALLLSDQAEMDAMPALEILADDVKCSHGSTIGALDEEALFYLRSRGIDEAEARAMLIRAFVEEATSSLQGSVLHPRIAEEMTRWLD